MDHNDIVNTASSAGAAVLGAPEASNRFNDSLKAAYKLSTYLTRKQTAVMRSHTDLPFVPARELSVQPNDHPILVAMRELTRQVHEQEHKIMHTGLRTLVIGATKREFSLYGNNPNIYFHFYDGGDDGENKDLTRTTLPLLEHLHGVLKKRMRTSACKRSSTKAGARVLARFRDLDQVISGLKTLDPSAYRIVRDPTLSRYDVLVFEDSIYQFNASAIVKLFSDTGASVAYGYGVYPAELEDVNVPGSCLYNYVEEGDYSYFTYPGGVSNGYTHKTSSWKTLVNNVVIRGARFNLVVEFGSRIGPFRTFAIRRTVASEHIVREVGPPMADRYVRVVDVMKSIAPGGSVNPALTYFSVYEEEFFSVVNYLLVIAPQSMTIQTAMTYIRRAVGGISLNNTDIVKPWRLEARYMYKLAVVAYMTARMVADLTEDVVRSAESGWATNAANIAKLVAGGLTYWALPLKQLYCFLVANNLKDRLVLYPDQSSVQRFRVPAMRGSMPYVTLLEPDVPTDDEPGCPFCAEINAALGEQKLLCSHKSVSDHNYTLTTAQLDAYWKDLVATDLDPVNLAELKKSVAKVMPRTGFSHVARTEYICGGPGTGKSYIIRAHASEKDMIVAPFSKLLDDYQTQDVDVGGGKLERKSFHFQTTHRSLRALGRKVIYVDEFASFPYEVLCMLAYINQAETIYLVGDSKQTSVREPVEGMSCLRHVDLDKLSKHTLVYNFRNNRFTVGLLNLVHGYKMIPKKTSTEVDIEYVYSVNDLPSNIEFMTHYRELAPRFGYPELSVRQMQGSTTDVAGLSVTESEGHLSVKSDFNIVALSRHRESLKILLDGSSVSAEFAARYPVGDSEFVKSCLDAIPTYRSLQHVVERDVDLDRFLGVLPTITGNLGASELSAMEEKFNLANEHFDEWAYSIRKRPSAMAAFIAKEPHIPYKPCKPMRNPLSWPVPASIPTSDYRVITGRSKPPVNFRFDSRKPLEPLLTDAVATNVKRAEFSSNFMMGVERFLPVVTTGATTSLPEVVPTVAEPEIQLGYDSHRLLADVTPNPAFAYTRPSYNSGLERAISSEFRNGVLSSDIICPVNQRGHPKPIFTVFHKFLHGHGISYDGKNPWQELASIQGRYLGPLASKPYNATAELYARQIADQFVEDCIDRKSIDSKSIFLDDNAIDAIVSRTLDDYRRKSYEAQSDFDFDPDVKNVRFHLKAIFKPVKGSKLPDLLKPGQGISAWSKTAQSLFGICFRVINEHFSRCLADNVIYDNLVSEDVLLGRINSTLSTLPEGALNGVTDGESYDSMQNRFSQEIEKQVLRRIGISEEFIANYYLFRNDYVLQGSHIRGSVGSVKTSGEPGTLLLNTILSMSLTNWLLRGEGPYMMIGKGDDGLKRQCNLRVLEDRLTEVMNYLPLKLKCSITDSMEFCGNIITDGVMVPSITRKVRKLLGHTFRDYKHFTQYQIALRDYLGLIERIGFNKVVVTNMRESGLGYLEISARIGLIQSFAHIDEDQYEELIMRFEEEVPFP